MVGPGPGTVLSDTGKESPMSDVISSLGDDAEDGKDAGADHAADADGNRRGEAHAVGRRGRGEGRVGRIVGHSHGKGQQ